MKALQGYIAHPNLLPNPTSAPLLWKTEHCVGPPATFFSISIPYALIRFVTEVIPKMLPDHVFDNFGYISCRDTLTQPCALHLSEVIVDASV